MLATPYISPPKGYKEAGFVPVYRPFCAGRHTLLLVDLGLDVKVEKTDNDVTSQIDAADHIQGEGIIERNALGDLHHTEDDDQVGAIICILALLFFPLNARM